MENHLYQVLSEKPRPGRVFLEEEQQIRRNWGRLLNTLNPFQKELLYDIINDKDVIAAKTAENQYTDGFRRGVRMMLAVFTQETDE